MSRYGLQPDDDSIDDDGADGDAADNSVARSLQRLDMKPSYRHLRCMICSLPDILQMTAHFIGTEDVLPGVREALEAVPGVASVLTPFCWCKIENKEGGRQLCHAEHLQQLCPNTGGTLENTAFPQWQEWTLQHTDGPLPEQTLMLVSVAGMRTSGWPPTASTPPIDWTELNPATAPL